MGIVYLVGAGPGDPGLVTVKAKELIEIADVIVYDYLAPKQCLAWARPDAEIIYVGKKGGDHTLPQEEINALLVEKGRQDDTVIVRLKGGDPYIFGRGAEEAEELIEAGVPFEVVPGVTSAVAGPAYAGIPLTHRKYASSVSFITGHEDPTKESSAHNWPALAASASTLVFFMGVKNLPHITSKLMEAGMRPDMPCALVHWGTTCRQRSFTSTIEKVPAEAQALGYKAPSLFVVGEVCTLKPKLDWFEERPLLGKGVVVTRAREQASDLSFLLGELGACVFEFPTISVEKLDDESALEQAVLSLARYDWIVFTSVNGVSFFFDKLFEVGLDARVLGGCQLAAIGPATAERLMELGLTPDFVPEKYVAESVVEGLIARGAAGKKVLIPRALAAREVLPEELRKAGATVDVVPVYRTSLAQNDPSEVLAALDEKTIDYMTFTSSSTVDNFFSLIPAETFKARAGGVRLAAIGPVTANTLKKHGFTADVEPFEYTIPGLVTALVMDQERS